MMLQLNVDILFLIFEELKNDTKSFYSYLLVNKTWCIMTVPILWRDPNIISLSDEAKRKLFDVIFLHLSKESRDILKSRGISNLFSETYQHPLFNYISFWKHLDLFFIEGLIFQGNIKGSNIFIIKNEIMKLFIKGSNIFIIKNEIMKLFINENTRFIHLYIAQNFNYKVHSIPGAEHCLSGLESFSCRSCVDQSILEGLSSICKSIKRLKFFVESFNVNINFGIIKLIEAQKNLNEVHLFNYSVTKSFEGLIEKSLIKHADTIQYLRIRSAPVTKFLSYLVNLSSLEIEFMDPWNNLNNFENFSVPNLKILRTKQVPYNILVNLIENTKGYLTEINTFYNFSYEIVNIELIIQAIYKNCLNLKYLLFSSNNSNSIIPEFETLLIKCQFLNELILLIHDHNDYAFSWDKLFIVLAKSSPISLLRFKFYSISMFNLKDIALFFYNWKNRNPMTLGICNNNSYFNKRSKNKPLEDLCEKYKLKGIIKKYIIEYTKLVDYKDFTAFN
ncbi:hypothetical protein RhiirA4_482792 [Rhizophagus irregularis]|uniref:F-box domain-containing protein n=1 Tax=Rhizophagus irregularis TaxID=588596 RepID=A0A2I1HLN8_9GLOM|nr:hypothetical protein RhiirA4_482792 [Rhizophagus irregularis]